MTERDEREIFIKVEKPVLNDRQDFWLVIDSTAPVVFAFRICMVVVSYRITRSLTPIYIHVYIYKHIPNILSFLVFLWDPPLGCCCLFGWASVLVVLYLIMEQSIGQNFDTVDRPLIESGLTTCQPYIIVKVNIGSVTKIPKQLSSLNVFNCYFLYWPRSTSQVNAQIWALT